MLALRLNELRDAREKEKVVLEADANRRSEEFDANAIRQLRKKMLSVLGTKLFVELDGLVETVRNASDYQAKAVFEFQGLTWEISSPPAEDALRVICRGEQVKVYSEADFINFMADAQRRLRPHLEREQKAAQQEKVLSSAVNEFAQLFNAGQAKWPKDTSLPLLLLSWDDANGHHDRWTIASEEKLRRQQIWVDVLAHVMSSNYPTTYAPATNFYYLWDHNPIGALIRAHSFSELPESLREPVFLVVKNIPERVRNEVYLLGYQPIRAIRDYLGMVGLDENVERDYNDLGVKDGE